MTFKCKMCGGQFRADDPSQTHCSTCRKIVKRINNPQLPKKTKKRKLSPIDAVVVEVEEYNKAHGTCLSYGKFVAMKERGLL